MDLGADGAVCCSVATSPITSYPPLTDARSVVVTQPNNKLSRVLKALLHELPAQLAAINAAGLEASEAASESFAAAGGDDGDGPFPTEALGGVGGGAAAAAADYARAKLAERLRLSRALQVAHNERVAREARGCAVNGAVLALPFSDGWRGAVASAVLNTGLHRTADARVKFAMAARVEPLGAAWVCRIWVYVAAVRDLA